MRASLKFTRGAAAFAVCTAILISGCSKDSTTAPKTLTSVSLTPANPTLNFGGTQALTLTGTYSDATTEVLTVGVTFTTSAASVATVSAAGLVTAVAAGTATITARSGARTATANITVNAAAALAVPTNTVPAPDRLAANVISLFSTVYTNRAVETWKALSSPAATILTDPFLVGARNLKKYALSNSVDIEFGAANIANAIDATTMTHFHVDVWTPNAATNFQILIGNATGVAGTSIGLYSAGTLATGEWVHLILPLSSFTGLTAKDRLNQLRFVTSGPMTIYVDNIYFFRE